VDDYITCINGKGVEFYRKKYEINPLTILLLIQVFVITFMLASTLIHICSKLCKLGIIQQINPRGRYFITTLTIGSLAKRSSVSTQA